MERAGFLLLVAGASWRRQQLFTGVGTLKGQQAAMSRAFGLQLGVLRAYRASKWSCHGIRDKQMDWRRGCGEWQDLGPYRGKGW